MLLLYFYFTRNKNSYNCINIMKGNESKYKLELLLATSIYDNEGDLQGMFTKYWVRGEWYKLSEEILEFIKNKKAKKI